MNEAPQEPTLLDYIKSKLKFWEQSTIELPAAPEETVAPVVPEKTDNSNALSNAEAARQAAVDAGADASAADLFAATDALYNELKDKSSSGTDESEGLKDVAARYKALEEYAKALELKNRIDQLNYDSYDKTDYDKGCSGIEAFKSIQPADKVSGSQMYDTSHQAYTSFDKVLVTAFKKLAQDARVAAFSAKRNADSIYAGVSQKNAYDVAVQSFRSGDASYSMQNPEAALKEYQDAYTAFDTLYKDISEKRAAAQKAIDDAKAKVAESAGYASQADKDTPLEGDTIQGIEAPDAVLLQAETYEDPKTSEADVPDSITDTTDTGTEAAK